MSWPTIAFEQAVESRGSGTRGLPQSEWQQAGKYPVIGQGAEYIEGWSDRDDLLVTPDPAVVLYGGHTRRAKFVTAPFVPGPNVKLLKPISCLDGNYLFRFLSQLPIESRGYADHFPEVRRCVIPLPPLAEQKRIAAILDAADALRAKRRESIEQLDSLIGATFLEMFGDPFADKHPEKTKVLFSELTDRITYGFTCPMQHLEMGVPILTAKNVLAGSIDWENVHFADRQEFNALTSKSKPKPGDILITKDGSIGRCAVMPDGIEACINQSVALVQPNRAKVEPIYLAAYIQCNAVQLRIQKMGKGNALKHLQITELAKFPAVQPPLYLQQRFASTVEAIEMQKARLKAHLAELDLLLASLQSRAFNGELVA